VEIIARERVSAAPNVDYTVDSTPDAAFSSRIPQNLPPTYVYKEKNYTSDRIDASVRATRYKTFSHVYVCVQSLLTCFLYTRQ